MQGRLTPKPLDPLPLPEQPAPRETTVVQAVPTQEPKSKIRSKTLWGIASAVAGVVLMGLGLDGSSAALLADGIQVEDIGPILTTIGTALAAWGIRKGTQAGATPVR